MTDAGRDGAAMLYTGAVAGVLLRGATWVFSMFTVGPVLGFLDVLAGVYVEERLILFSQALVTVAAVVAAILCGLGLQSDPARYRLPARVLAGLFIADVVVYLVPLILLFTVDLSFSPREWGLFGVAVVGNLGLAGLSLLVILRTAAPKPAATWSDLPVEG